MSSFQVVIALCPGLTVESRCVSPHPPITRALRMAKEKLQAAGVKVVDWEPYKHQRGWEIIVSAANLVQFNLPPETCA